MSVFKVELISTETVKPSSPTPDHLRHYQLSFLDQISPPIFMPLLFFYEKPHEDKDAIFNHLKKSLSDTLTGFYPLAGRIKENLFIECNDGGIPYVQAKVNCELSKVMEEPNPGQHNKLLPFKLDELNDLLLAVQVNLFDCGGIAVAICISHKVGDALSYFMLVNSWAATGRGDTDIKWPRFDSAQLFPPKNISGFEPSTGITKEEVVTKRFVFSASSIAELRDKYSEKANAENPTRPTRVEALSAFIWTRFMESTQSNADLQKKLYTILHAVNLRTRTDPPLPEYSFGNISRIAITAPRMEKGEECYKLIDQMRDAIRNVDVDYVKQLAESEEHLSFLKEAAAIFNQGGWIAFSFTSLCRFPLYEADFGWGKPIWVGSARLTFNHLVTFFDTRTGGGIEAWINLKPEDMAKFEADKELLSYVSSSPSKIVA